jgi:hypothetical protein
LASDRCTDTTAFGFARVMPAMPRTGSQYSTKRIVSCGARKPYVSWSRKRPAWISTYALWSSESAFRQSRPSASPLHDQIFFVGASSGPE